MQKIACLDSIEALLSNERRSFYYLLSDNSPFRSVIKGSVPKSHIIRIREEKPLRFYVNDKQALTHSNALKLMKAHRINKFLVSYRLSRSLDNLLKSKDIEAISPPSRMQRKLEDKLIFDSLLKESQIPSPSSVLIQSSKDLQRIPYSQYVLQAPFGEGAEKTYFVRNHAERAELKKLTLKYPLLCRKFIHGLPVGVSLVISQKNILFSSLRVQILLKSKGQSLFAGIQWLPTKFLSPLLKKHLEDVLQRLTKTLQGYGFRGVANIDLILTKHKALVIECNPRFAGSSPLLCSHPELLHGRNFMSEHLKAISGKNCSVDIQRIPNTNYQGCAFEIGNYAEEKFNLTHGRLKAHAEMGVYRHLGHSVKFLSPNLGQFKGKDTFAYLASALLGEHLGHTCDLGVLMCNFPLYDVTNAQMPALPGTEKFLNAFAERIAETVTIGNTPSTLLL